MHHIGSTMMRNYIGCILVRKSIKFDLNRSWQFFYIPSSSMVYYIINIIIWNQTSVSYVIPKHPVS